MTEKEDQFGGLPVRRWREIDVLKDDELVLARNASRQIFGYRQDGKWFEMVDGEEYEIDGGSSRSNGRSPMAVGQNGDDRAARDDDHPRSGLTQLAVRPSAPRDRGSDRRVADWW